MSDGTGGRPPKHSDAELLHILATYEHRLAAAEELAADPRVDHDDPWSVIRRFEPLVGAGLVTRRKLNNATLFYIPDG